MASKHPLDVFRSSSSGFEQASRQRRTIAGKVITSRSRDEDLAADDESAPSGNALAVDAADVEPAVTPEPGAQAGRPSRHEKRSRGAPGTPAQQPPTTGRPSRRERRRQAAEAAAATQRAQAMKPGGERLSAGSGSAPSAGAEAPRSFTAATTLVEPEPRPLSAPPFGLERRNNLKTVSQVMLYGSCLVVAALMIWIGVQHDWSGDEPLKQASAADVLAAGPGASGGASSGAEAGAGELFTIQAASYSPSEKGQLRAWDAHDALEARGYSDVLVTGDQLVDASGTVRLTSCVLLVGRSEERRQLESVLASLGAIDDWPTGSASPFADARIVSHPHPGDG